MPSLTDKPDYPLTLAKPIKPALISLRLRATYNSL